VKIKPRRPTVDEPITKPNPLKDVFRPFVAGVLALLPIALTFSVIAWLATIIHDLVGPGSTFGNVLKQIGWKFVPSDSGAYLGGVVFAVALIYVFGFAVRAGLKNVWERWSDSVLSRVPLVSTVYDAAKKIVDMMEPQDNVELQSMTPVLCSFGAKTGTGFPAFMPTSEVFMIQNKPFHVVMIPTAPIPFGGAILCVPRDWVTPMDCGIDGLLNMYMSMGTTVPQYFGKEPGNGGAATTSAQE
jgi:uncharacterized membrane protein